MIYLIYGIGSSIYGIILNFNNKYYEFYVKTYLEKEKEALESFKTNEYSFMSESEIRKSFETGRVNGIYFVIILYIILVNINKYFYIKLFIYISIYHFYFL